MTDNVKYFLELSGKEEVTIDDRKNLLKAMTSEEIDYLIGQAGNQQAKIFYAQFKK
jgi:hypothetical protein